MKNLDIPVVDATIALQPVQHQTAGGDRLQLVLNEQLQFDVRRDDQVRTSSTRFCGGLWRWRLSSGDGTVLATSAEYQTEEACRAALAIIRRHAGTAILLNS